VTDENDIIQKEHWEGKFYEANELESRSYLNTFPPAGYSLIMTSNLGETRLQINKSRVGLPVVPGDELLSGRFAFWFRLVPSGISTMNGSTSAR
jgi:hypothetical protein